MLSASSTLYTLSFKLQPRIEIPGQVMFSNCGKWLKVESNEGITAPSVVCKRDLVQWLNKLNIICWSTISEVSNVVGVTLNISGNTFIWCQKTQNILFDNDMRFLQGRVSGELQYFTLSRHLTLATRCCCRPHIYIGEGLVLNVKLITCWASSIQLH